MVRTVSRTSLDVLVRVAAAALVILCAVGCTATVAPSPTPCPELAGWPPLGLPAPPAAVVVLHPPGTDLRVINQTGSAITIRYRVWTPLDCGLSPPAVGLAASRLRPGRAAEWSATELAPTRGPVLGGLEVWMRPCNEPCPDPPDAFTAFELRPLSR